MMTRMRAMAARLVAALALAGLTAWPGGTVSAQSTVGLPTEARRQMAFGRALAGIGRSGLRSLLSASGSLGDLQNRVGSYRMAAQLERARTGPLEGRVEALDRALTNPELGVEERAAITKLRDETVAALADVPRYDAAYATGTAQVEAMLPMGFVAGRPSFLLVRGRGHARWGGDEGLTVFSEGVSLGPVLVASDRWIFSPGVTLGRTDVDIGPFQGSSGTTSGGPKLDVGGILSPSWSVAVQLAHTWAHGRSTILRPGPGDPVEVRSEGWSQVTTAKAEAKGRLAGGRVPWLAIRPSAGAFITATHSPATENSLGETGTGPFGAWENLAAVRAGASVDADVGAWSPALYLGWERELTRPMTPLVDDRTAFVGSAGLAWSWSTGRRMSLDYRWIRGSRGLRRVSELTFVLILDG